MLAVQLQDRLLSVDDEADEELEHSKFWVQLRHNETKEKAGKLLLSMQLVPEELISSLPAGTWRRSLA